jgi:para-aminobenzoate synthetase
MMRTLVIDNYDSFTYNLVHLLAEINQEEPLVVRNDQVTWSELREKKYDNIVISPGPGHPGVEADLGISKRAILESTVPLLGVCLGHQGIALFSGGSVLRAPMPMHGRTSEIHHCGSEIFANIPSPFEGACYHSLHVARPLPPCLEELAWTAGDTTLVMGLRHRDRPQWGVQFHPESIISEHGRRLLENFRTLTWKASQKPRVPKTHSKFETETQGASSSQGCAVWQEIPRAVNSEAAFATLFADSPTAFWLDSNLNDPNGSRWSYLGDVSGPNAALVQYRAADARLEIIDARGARTERRSVFDYLNEPQLAAPQPPPPCPFVGGHVGWFGYELRNECGSPSSRSAVTPDALFIRADRFIAFDHVNDRTYAVAIDNSNERSRAERWVSDTVRQLLGAKPEPQVQAAHQPRLPLQFRLDRSHATYISDIERCLELIRAGETYQVCLTNEISCRANVDPLALYRIMRKINPAPYAAFIKWPGGAVLSASPERFLSVDASGNVETKPIKGTIGRDRDPIRDRRLADQLQHSEKDRSENVMIVDLLRNDLSRVCVPGSVVVPKLYGIESYATVHQLVSTIRGVVAPAKTAVDLIRATFPGGSMTGAPKIRTMEYIDMLERRPRGVYSGALGWLGDDGAADLSIVIRTIVATDGTLSLGSGGGIVALSDPQAEFDEMVLKAEASIKAITLACFGNTDAANCRRSWVVEEGTVQDASGTLGS